MCHQTLAFTQSHPDAKMHKDPEKHLFFKKGSYAKLAERKQDPSSSSHIQKHEAFLRMFVLLMTSSSRPHAPWG
jgi:hypothetical protein